MISLVFMFYFAFSTTFAYPWAIDDALLVGPRSVGSLVKGPSEDATIIGPDGSQINSHVDTGAISSSSLNEGVIARSVTPVQYTRTVPILKSYPIVSETLPIVESRRIENLVRGSSASASIIEPTVSQINTRIDTGITSSSSINEGVITKSIPVQYTHTTPILKSSEIVTQSLPVIGQRVSVIERSVPVVHHVQYSAPIERHTVPLVRSHVPLIQRGVSAVSYSVPTFAKNSGTVIEGPSGVIATYRSVDGVTGDVYNLDC